MRRVDEQGRAAGNGGMEIPGSSGEEDNRDGSWSQEQGGETLVDALSKSMEMCYLLQSRSPWLGEGRTLSGSGPALWQQRDRSLSHASSHGNSLGRYDQLSPAGSDPDNYTRAHPSFSDFEDAQRGRIFSQGDLSSDSKRLLGEMGDDLAAERFPEEVASSGFWTSVFNATNVLMGVGLLSLPYTMRLSGWIGVVLVALIAAVTAYSALLLGRIMNYVPKRKLREGSGAYTMYGFHDMGYVAFGNAGKVFISVVFIIETFGYACVYFIIEGENLMHQLHRYPYFESWSRSDFMVASAFLFTPTVLLRDLSWLSYLSALGVLSSVCLFVGVFVSGLQDPPLPNPLYCEAELGCTGSLFHPSKTEMVQPSTLPQVLGLIMVGFSGHALFPTLRNDMAKKEQYPKMVGVVYLVVTSVYIAISVVGYRMFGNSAQPEVTLNLSPTSLIAQITVWIVVLNPITKFALDMTPIAMSVEQTVKVYFRIQDGFFFTCLSTLIRIFLVAFALLVVITIPDFATFLGVMGSFCALTISLGFPCLCYAKLFWDDLSRFELVCNVFLGTLGAFGALFGTVVAVLNVDTNPVLLVL